MTQVKLERKVRNNCTALANREFRTSSNRLGSLLWLWMAVEPLGKFEMLCDIEASIATAKAEVGFARWTGDE